LNTQEKDGTTLSEA